MGKYTDLELVCLESIKADYISNSNVENSKQEYINKEKKRKIRIYSLWVSQFQIQHPPPGKTSGKYFCYFFNRIRPGISVVRQARVDEARMPKIKVNINRLK